jgi:Zn-dependent peptidase ImmA (M78 family)
MSYAAIQHWKTLKGSPLATPAALRSRFGQTRPPFDPYAIAHGLGVDIRHITDRRWSGAVKFAGDRAVIWLNDADGRRRKRFTLAHELGHLLLHGEEGRGMFRDATFAGTKLEREANEFAAELLMPASILRKYGAMAEFDLGRLAKALDVSEEALQVRLSVLGKRQARRLQL